MRAQLRACLPPVDDAQFRASCEQCAAAHQAVMDPNCKDIT